MAKVATITADFRAEAAQFLRELKNVSEQSRRTATTLKELSSVVSTIGGVLSVGAFAAFVRSSAQAADQLAKTADRLGVTTERLQTLRFAARSAGVDVSVLDQALFDAQQRLSEAAQTGKGPAADWIVRLNLNIGELRKLAPDQLFERYAQAISGLTSRGDQLNAAQDLMGKGAKELLGLIDGGRPALQQAAEDIRQLGLEITRVDAAQIEAANDQFDRLQAVTEGIGQQIAVAVAPYVGAFVGQLIEASRQGEGLRAKIELATRIAFYGFNLAANAVRVFDAAVSGAVVVVAKPIEALATGLRRLREFQAEGFRLVGLKTLAEDYDSAAQKLSGVEGLMASVSEQAAARVQNALAGIKSFQQIGQEADRILAEARQAAEEQAAQRATAQAGMTGGGVPSEKGRTDLERMSGILGEQLKWVDELAKQRQEIIGNYIEREIEAYAQAAERRIEIERAAEEAIREQKAATIDYTIGLFQALSQKNKLFALAALALEKVTTIQRVLQANAIAAELAFASQLIPGDPTSLARAAAAKAAVLAQGRIQAALIAATGLVQAASLFSGGGGSSSNAAASASTTQATQTASESVGAQQGRVITVNLNGPISGPDAARWLIDQLADLINGNDTIIINGNSAQAREILGT